MPSANTHSSVSHFAGSDGSSSPNSSTATAAISTVWARLDTATSTILPMK